MAAPKDKEIAVLEANLRKAQEAVANAKAALPDVSPALFDEYEKAARNVQQVADEGNIPIFAKKQQELAGLAANSDYIMPTSGAGNNCLLEALNQSSAEGTHALKLNFTVQRNSLYGLYRTLFADDFPNNIRAPDGYNNMFGFNPPKTLDGIKDALTALRDQLITMYAGEVIGEPGIDSSKPILHNLLNPTDRMLHAADLVMLALLHRCSIIVVKNGGREQIFDPTQLANGAFASAPPNRGGPVYVQHNGVLHFQGINKAGVEKYNEIEKEEQDARDKLSQDIQNAQQVQAGAFQKIEKVLSSDPAFVGLCANYEEAVQDLLTKERDLARAQKRGTPVVPPSPKAAAAAAPVVSPSAPLVTDQLLNIQKKRDEIDPKDVAVADLDKLQALHRQRDIAIKNLERLKRGESVPAVGGAPAVAGRKEYFTYILFDDPLAAPQVIANQNVDNVKGDKDSSLFLSFMKPSVTDAAAYRTGIDKAQKAATPAAFRKLLDKFSRTAALEVEKKNYENTNLQANKFLVENASQLETLNNKCNELQHQIDNLMQEGRDYVEYIKRFPAAKDPQREYYFTTTNNKLQRELGAASANLNNLHGQVARASNDAKISKIALQNLDNKLSEKASDKAILQAAFDKFHHRMQALAKQQADGTGDVLNPLDVQWAAIMRQQTIIVVKSDGTTHTFSPDIFDDEDLKFLVDADLGKQCKEKALTEMGVAVAPATDKVVYVYDNGGEYQHIKEIGQKLCASIPLDCAKIVEAAEQAVAQTDKEIAKQVADMSAKAPDDVKKQIAEYSSLLGNVEGTLRAGNPPVVSGVKQVWEEKLDSAATVSITAAQENQRDIHRQNIDVLLTLLLQGTPADRAAFDAAFTGAATNPAIINLNATNKYGIPFDNAPMFYAKDLTPPAFPGLIGKDADERISNLITHEINAYLASKKMSPESALANDYRAILIALNSNVLEQNNEATGLKDIPDSVMKPVLEGIHERVAAKAGHVANMIDANAYDAKFGKTFAEQKGLREGVHHYRQAVNKQPQTNFDPATVPAPKAARALKQTSYVTPNKPARIVFDVKGMTVDQVMAAFNENTPARNAALSVKNDENIDCRIVAKKEGGRLKLELQKEDGSYGGPLTTTVWAAGAQKAITQALTDIAGQDAQLSKTEHSKPRMR